MTRPDEGSALPIMTREEAQRAIDLEGAAPPPSVRLDACRAVVALHDRVATLSADLDDLLRGGDIDVALGGHRSGPRVAGRYGQEVDGRVFAQPEQQGVFAGTGSDHEDSHDPTP